MQSALFSEQQFAKSSICPQFAVAAQPVESSLRYRDEYSTCLQKEIPEEIIERYFGGEGRTPCVRFGEVVLDLGER
ncbi:hypothetical protein FF011L_26850 [Roseimaritima multifibrata]|uniref:Uncharacterized protein n=1 Tax=Roseimaritima multifibrata TaxID=1930274 RepID=A0A517MG99_9BACT|nr:hypothetical protein [Roseimaritima multifibrata]QDS93908.1 hypothetical protein FF011L_26850 [Roseimaritima multifibrata]